MVNTDAEKLAQIRAYAEERATCGRMGRTVHSARIASDLLAILAEPGPAVPPESIDRDALASARRRIAVLYMAGTGGEAAALDLRLAIDEIDASLAGPVESATLTPEARESAWQEYRRTHSGLFPDARLDFTAGWDALAARLEASA